MTKSDDSVPPPATVATLATEARIRALKHRSKSVPEGAMVATPATLATVSSLESSPDVGYVATPATKLGEYLDVLADFSPESLSDSLPKPPFPDPPERGKAWAAWWSAIDRRNRKFKVGRWEPLVSPQRSTAIANNPNDEPDTVHPVPATAPSTVLPEQLSLTDFSETESRTDNGQLTRSDSRASSGPRRGTPVVA
jgi:hypothetical protein